eukprot:jgi/Bigna1/136437/aug1.34_g11145
MHCTHNKFVERLRSVDCHAGGEPARVIVEGLPEIPGTTMFEKRNYCMQHLDHLRRLLLQEPRGYPCQNANLIVPPTKPEAAYGFIILEQNGGIYPLMSGHNTMCVATALLETGMIPMEELSSSSPSEEITTEFKLEAPGGIVDIRARCKDYSVTDITIRGYPSFVAITDAEVHVPEVGTVKISIAYGGMWYVIVQAEDVGLQLLPENGREIARKGEMIKVAAQEQFPVQHPYFDYKGPDILVFISPPNSKENSGRNAVVMSNGELDWNKPETWVGMLDRSPCGTGTCAVMAKAFMDSSLQLGEDFRHESIVGSVFTGRLVEEISKYGTAEDDDNSSSSAGSHAVEPTTAVIPEISGRAFVTSFTDIVLHADDPFPEGYTVGDIWAS